MYVRSFIFLLFFTLASFGMELDDYSVSPIPHKLLEIVSINGVSFPKKVVKQFQTVTDVFGNEHSEECNYTDVLQENAKKLPSGRGTGKEYLEKLSDVSKKIYITSKLLEKETRERVMRRAGVINSDIRQQDIATFISKVKPSVKNHINNFSIYYSCYTEKNVTYSPQVINAYRKVCIQTLIKNMEHISHETFVAMGTDFNYLNLSIPLSEVFADVFCLRGSYAYLREQYIPAKVELAAIDNGYTKYKYILKNGYSDWRQWRDHFKHIVAPIKPCKKLVKKNRYSVAKLIRDNPEVVRSDDIFINLIAGNLFTIKDIHCIGTTPEVRFIDLSGNNIDKMNIRYIKKAFPNIDTTFPFNYNKGIRISKDDIKVQNKKYWKIRAKDCGITYFPASALITAPTGELFLTGHQLSDNQVKDIKRYSRHWIRKTIQAIPVTVGCTTFIISSWLILRYFNARETSFLHNTQKMQDIYLKNMLDNHDPGAIKTVYDIMKKNNVINNSIKCIENIKDGADSIATKELSDLIHSIKNVPHSSLSILSTLLQVLVTMAGTGLISSILGCSLNDYFEYYNDHSIRF